MKKLKMKDVITREGYECLNAEERRAQLKVEQAKEQSGLRRYPGTCSAVQMYIKTEIPCRAHRRGHAAAESCLRRRAAVP